MAVTTPSPAVTSIEDRLAELRELAKTDPKTASEQTWAWFREAGDKAQADSEAADAELNALFRLGTTPAEHPDGCWDLMFVTPLVHPIVDNLTRVVTSVWMPAQGKRFRAADNTGDNALVSSARFPAKLFWPFYRMHSESDGLIAFEFKTEFSTGLIDTGIAGGKYADNRNSRTGLG